MKGSLSLAEYPGEPVQLKCERCGRSGQYRKQTLAEIFGTDVALPDLRHLIARCDRRGKMHDACAVHYPGLAENA
jgi:hypothetical protein